MIRVKSGAQRITVPVSAHNDPKIHEVLLFEPERNLKKVAKTISEAYAKTPHYDDGMELVSIIEDKAVNGTTMADLNVSLIKHVIKRMGILSDVLMGYEDLRLQGHKDDRIFMMCAKTGADTYYSGVGAKVYHQEERYVENGIRLVYSDYQPVVYRQKYEPFIENMSVADYVFNEGYKIPES